MKSLVSTLLLIISFSAVSSGNDLSIFHSKLDAFIKQNVTQPSVEQISSSFLNTPYVAHTLEDGLEEKLIVNLRGLDCTTYIENVIALKRLLDNQKDKMADFRNELQYVRYRDGELKGYSSRLHYFSDWLINNERKGLIKRLTQELGGKPLNKKIDFMSTHPDAYKRINSKNLLKIKSVESNLAKQKLFYIPLNEIAKVSDQINTGDIIAITTKIRGLDITHVGFGYRQPNGKLHLQHASTSGSVVISKQPLQQYLEKNSNNNGIMVARIL